MDYGRFYERISRIFRNNGRLHAALIYFNMYFTYTMYILYPCLLVMLLFTERKLFLRTLIVPAVFFYVLTEVRKKINRERPYEKWNMDVLLEKSTRGNSMPSRHVFSAVMITMCIYQVSPALGTLLLVFCAFSAVVRVLLGVHYPLDVIVGYLCGLLGGWVMYLL
ncbi:MAG: phosphatase PAP2 family protein [Erysipelotrichaceae bacterium]|nr:phosphatase PAP2 family protein [Erysipelotrichaceae bacterium]